jgi:hypothetical protein
MRVLQTFFHIFQARANWAIQSFVGGHFGPFAQKKKGDFFPLPAPGPGRLFLFLSNAEALAKDLRSFASSGEWSVGHRRRHLQWVIRGKPTLDRLATVPAGHGPCPSPLRTRSPAAVTDEMTGETGENGWAAVIGGQRASMARGRLGTSASDSDLRQASGRAGGAEARESR